ncbi:MAG: hypothetical protein LBG15_04850, partial [Dysgonamonadaceae bacterium]|nr:hypothetical protein [Dysgonamonadaceae bacterium]
MNTIESLLVRALAVINETRKRMNTADRIGSLFRDILTFIQSDVANKDEINQLKYEDPLYNVTVKHPLASGNYYTLTTARVAVPVAVRKKGLIITYQVSATQWRTEQYFQGELYDWTKSANWRAVDGPDLLLATDMADLYSKLNDASWWLNGYAINDKALIKNIRCTQAAFTGTLIVTRSAFTTQYLIG